LGGFLGVLARAGDTRRQAIQALTVTLDKPIGGIWILSAQCPYECGIAIDLRIQHVGHPSITSRLTRSHRGTPLLPDVPLQTPKWTRREIDQ
jgi:hypothetical protein